MKNISFFVDRMYKIHRFELNRSVFDTHLYSIKYLVKVFKILADVFVFSDAFCKFDQRIILKYISQNLHKNNFFDVRLSLKATLSNQISI